LLQSFPDKSCSIPSLPAPSHVSRVTFPHGLQLSLLAVNGGRVFFPRKNSAVLYSTCIKGIMSPVEYFFLRPIN
jgi:hypothetical protein